MGTLGPSLDKKQRKEEISPSRILDNNASGNRTSHPNSNNNLLFNKKRPDKNGLPEGDADQGNDPTSRRTGETKPINY